MKSPKCKNIQLKGKQTNAMVKERSISTSDNGMGVAPYPNHDTLILEMEPPRVVP